MKRRTGTYTAPRRNGHATIKRVAIAVLVLFVASAMSQQSAPAPYEVGEAYEVYRVVLHDEGAYGFGQGMLVIEQETVPRTAGLEGCLSSEAANRFKDAIADYHRVNRKTWLLQRKFEIENYELVRTETINMMFKQGGWQGGWGAFYKRYPQSLGYLTVSAVGINENKTLAMVLVYVSCGFRCGESVLHLLEKVDGKWRQLQGDRLYCNAVVPLYM